MSASSAELVESWNLSYGRNENNIQEPFEELVKFLARYVYNRNPGDGSLALKNQFSGKNISNLRVIDIGCGIGAQSLYLAQNGFCVNGYDISEVAISFARQRCSHLTSKGNPSFSVVDPSDYQICDAFDIAIACGSLDSMPFNCAIEWMAKVGKACNPAALFFASFIGPSLTGDPTQEHIIENELHESGTVQSYFDEAKIKLLFGEGGFNVLRLDFVQVSHLIPNDTFQRSSGRYFAVAIKNE